MRRFHNEGIRLGLADALSSIHLNIPHENARNALQYLKQYVNRHSGKAHLYRGYITEEYVDCLVEVRDASDSQKFADIVKHIGVNGNTSQEVTDEFNEFGIISFESDYDLQQDLSKVYYQMNTDEARRNVRTMQNLISNVRYGNTVTMYLPQESVVQLEDHL